MKRIILLLVVLCSFSLSFAQYTVQGTLSTSSPSYNRPETGTPPASLSPGGSNFYYFLLPIYISNPGLYNISCVSNNFIDGNSFGSIYSSGGFDANNPLANIIIANDDKSISDLNYGITYNFTTPGIYFVVTTTYATNVTGNFTLLIANGTLPVSLTSFNAFNSGKVNIITWTTAEEFGVDKFLVEGSSNGRDFKEIISTTSPTNSSREVEYQSKHFNPKAGNNYYRLKIVDIDGHIAFSNVVKVNNAGAAGLSVKIYPNPVTETLSFDLDNFATGKYSVSIINSTGAIQKKEIINTVSGTNNKISVSGMSQGKYTLRIQAGSEVVSSSFIKN